MLNTMTYWFLMETALKTTALLGASWLAALLLRRKSAALRHLVWSVAFTSVLALPFLSMALPALRLPVASSMLSTAFVFQAHAQTPAANESPAKSRPYGRTAPELKSERGVRWGAALIFVWFGGAVINLIQMLIGLVAIERLRRKAKPLTMVGFASMTKLLELGGQVNLLQTDEGSMPITSGLFRSTIFMPADAMEWNPERRRAVLLHELAHVRRRDGAKHLLARTALGLYWWNPVVWAAWREFLKERERAADDLVLNLGARPSDYAGHLLEIASAMQLGATFGAVAVPMARRSQLEGRVAAILDSVRDRKTPQRASVIVASLSAILIMAPIAALQGKNDTAQTTSVSSASVGPVTAILIKEGDEARELGKSEAAKASYNKALTMLSSGSEAATVLIHLGTVELATKNFEQSISDFERAETLDKSKTSEARLWMAIAQQRQNNLQVADALYQSALAAEAPNSASSAVIMNLYAGLLEQQGRLVEANAIRNESDSILKAQANQSNSSSQSASSDVYRIGGEVTAPVLLSKVEPEFSADARIAKYQGMTLLSLDIGVDGLAGNVRVMRGLGFGLDQKAIEAIRQWRFKPATKNGQPVKVAANIEVHFRLL